jgi:chromosomal replication initiator protein
MSIRIAEVQALIAERYQMPAGAMTGQSRRRIHAHPRQLAMYIAYKLTGQSTTIVGRHFGGRDHTTVIHARREVEARMLNSEGFAQMVFCLEDELQTWGGNYLNARAITAAEQRARAVADMQTAAWMAGAL